MKLATSLEERGSLAQDSLLTNAAARHPFWRGLPADVVRLFGAGLVARRYRCAKPGDFSTISDIMERQLAACVALPGRRMAEAASWSALVVDDLGPDDRERLAEVLGDEALPASSMHGDLHFFNFVRSRSGFRIIDWEDFDDRGSFVFDYVDFHVAIDQLNGARHWPTTLGALSLDHPALQHAAEASQTTPRALRAYYLMRKVATILKRRAAIGVDNAAERLGLLRAVRNAIAPAAAFFVHAGLLAG